MDRKQTTLDFLRFAREGEPSAERLVTPGARHHNPYFQAGMSALLDVPAENPNTDGMF